MRSTTFRLFHTHTRSDGLHIIRMKLNYNPLSLDKCNTNSDRLIMQSTENRFLAIDSAYIHHIIKITTQICSVVFPPFSVEVCVCVCFGVRVRFRMRVYVLEFCADQSRWEITSISGYAHVHQFFGYIFDWLCYWIDNYHSNMHGKHIHTHTYIPYTNGMKWNKTNCEIHCY